jgi:hypothetical protein
VKADEPAEPAAEGGDPACWMHEFEEELLGDAAPDEDAEDSSD